MGQCDSFFGDIFMWNPNLMSKGTCDPRYTKFEHPCRGDTTGPRKCGKFWWIPCLCALRTYGWRRGLTWQLWSQKLVITNVRAARMMAVLAVACLCIAVSHNAARDMMINRAAQYFFLLASGYIALSDWVRRPNDKSCWRYCFRYHQHICKVSRVEGFMIQVLEREINKQGKAI